MCGRCEELNRACAKLLRDKRRAESKLDPQVRMRMERKAEIYTGFPTKMGTDIRALLDHIESLED